ncbi:MAG: sugar:sodium symporter, partial [Lachnospiraceae bacterium]|nr:sugar:sodium symporter [Lachnospiraceae bacterium]
FVVKLASGIAAFIASISLSVFSLSSESVAEADKAVDFSKTVAASSQMGLRMVMTLIPIVGLFAAIICFKKKFKLSDEELLKVQKELAERKK